MAKTQTIVVKAKGRPGVWVCPVYYVIDGERQADVFIWDGYADTLYASITRVRDAVLSAKKLANRLNLPYLGRQSAA